jgi:hypothetical protein
MGLLLFAMVLGVALLITFYVIVMVLCARAARTARKHSVLPVNFEAKTEMNK